MNVITKIINENFITKLELTMMNISAFIILEIIKALNKIKKSN